MQQVRDALPDGVPVAHGLAAEHPVDVLDVVQQEGAGVEETGLVVERHPVAEP